MTTRLLLLAVLGLVLQCFSAWKAFPSSTMHRRSSQLNMKHTEGNGLAAFARSLSWKPFASIAMSSMLLTSPLQIDLQHSQIHTNYAQAAVGEGDLPPGPIAFSRLQRFQKDWQDVMKRVLSLKEELPKDERSNVKVFMKRLANEYFDMELLSKSIQDKSKAEQAIQIAKDIRGKARECDDAISANNYKKLEELNPMVTKAFQDFFETLNDVPDEL